MELSLSGNSLRTFHRSIVSLARIGTDLVLEASPSQLVLHTLNSSRSAYQSITFKPDFLDSFNIRPPSSTSSSSSSSGPTLCSVLLKSVCSVLRTPISSVDRLSADLPSPEASKLQWTLQCHNGVKKTYWINCNVEPDIQHLSLDRRRFPSSFVIRPKDLSRLLSNFQSSLQEITIIATEPSAVPSDMQAEIGGKAVELRSYIDPTKDNSDSALHTQLWIDPAEEFLQYTHVGDAVDVTFGMKELKAFLSFCEGCEVDIHLFFEKAGEPILMAPKFGFDDSSNSNFDATIVLATMLVSQITEGNATEQPQAASGSHANDVQGNDIQSKRARIGVPAAASENPSNHTKIWSDLSGSAPRTTEANRDGHTQMDVNPSYSMHNNIERPDLMNAANAQPAMEKVADKQPMDIDRLDEPQGRTDVNVNPTSQHHPNNWVVADDDDEEDEGDLYVQSTPHFDD